MSRERQPGARIRARLLGLACRPDIQKDTRDDTQRGTRAQPPVPAARLGRQESVS
jgi:hypothetical protein